MTINVNSKSNEILTATQLMQARFVTASLIVNFSQNKVTLHGEAIVLQPKVLELLIILCAAKGKTLSKQELIDKLWVDTVVGPDSLANTMTKLRKALKDDPKNPQFIKTVQRKGYIWLPNVESIRTEKKNSNGKILAITASAIVIAAFVYYFTLPKDEPNKFPFLDLSIQTLDKGGYEIQVGIDGNLTEEKKAAMLEELKRITGEEHSHMEFTVDEITTECIDNTTDINMKQKCEKTNKKQ
jgi:DNA-binding winged helix-turn-helix (wHTH) protein